MSQWPSAKAKRVLAVLLSIGWEINANPGRIALYLAIGWPDFVFAFHDGEKIGPRMLARISKHTGLAPKDLWGFFVFQNVTCL